jgi:hypothetical protein
MGRFATLTLANRMRGEPVLDGRTAQSQGDHSMTNSHQLQTINGVLRIEHQGHFYAEDELREAIWLVNIELRNGLPKREKIESKRQIEQYEKLLAALRDAAA